MKRSIPCLPISFVALFLLTVLDSDAQRVRGERLGGGGSHCVPSFTNGTQFGDYIDDVILEDISNVQSGNTAGPDYTDYSYQGLNFMAELAMNSNYSISITSGSWASDALVAWIDYDNDDQFETTEMLGVHYTSSAFETANLSFTVPTGIEAGYKTLRVMCAFTSDPDPNPCGNGYDYGEAEDYIVLVQPTLGCIPRFTYGNTDGDYINSISLSGMTDMHVPNSYPYSPPIKPAHVDAGSTYSINIESGDYSNDNFSVWVDWNNDRDFDDANESIGDYTTNSSFESFVIPLNIPSGIHGWYKMRVVCADIVTPAACPSDSYGETKEYMLVINNPNLPCYTYNYYGNTVPWGGTHISAVSVQGNPWYNTWIRPNHTVKSTDDPTHVYPGDLLTVNITAGDILSDHIKMYFDANADLIYGPSEDVDSALVGSVGQVIAFTLTVPPGTLHGIHFLRIGAYGAQVFNLNACSDPDFGVVFDIPIFVDDPNGPCTPAFNNWTRYGDYIDGVELNTLSNLNSGSQWGAHYTNYPITSFTTEVFTGSSYPITITAGEYFDNDYHVWVDHNDDNDFDDAGDYVGVVSNNSAGQVMTLNYMVPNGIALGERAMRVKCGLTTVPDPCADEFAGETEDYRITITTSTGIEGHAEELFSCSLYDDVLAINSVGTGEAYMIYDQLGKLVLEGTLVAKRTEVGIGQLQAGAYRVVCIAEHGYESHLVMIFR